MTDPVNQIPVGWKQQSIRSLGGGRTGTVQTGPFGAQLHAEDYVEEGIPLLLIRNLQAGRLRMEGMPRIRDTDAARLSRYALQRGDVVFSRVGRVGSCFLADLEHEGWLISGQLLRVRIANYAIENSYLYRALTSRYAQDHIYGASVGTTRTSINTQILESLELWLPTDRREQSKIAEILSAADCAIEQREALIVKQERIKTGLIQDLLTRGIDENGNLRSEQTHEFKDSPLGRIPTEWEITRVWSVLSREPKNGHSPVASDQWNGFYMLGLGCLTPDGFIPTQLKYAPPVDRACEGALLSHGDFLISRSNTPALVGLVGIYRDVGEPCIYPDLMIRLYFKEVVSPAFMEMIFGSAAVRRQLESKATGTSGSMVKINAAVVKQCIFARPGVKEQERLLVRFNAQRLLLQELRDAQLKLVALKTGLMQDLLTGRQRVTALLTRDETVTG